MTTPLYKSRPKILITKEHQQFFHDYLINGINFIKENKEIDTWVHQDFGKGRNFVKVKAGETMMMHYLRNAAHP